MTFFSLEQRQFNSPSKNKINLGPGHYSKQNEKKQQLSESYAPFGSLQKKKIKFKPNNIGPGSYNVSNELCKPMITKYQNNNCIIIKINQQSWSQFKSKTNRFQQNHQQVYYSPGPGQYQPIRQRPRSFSKKTIHSKIGQKIKQINLKNYIQRRKPTLFSDPICISEKQQNNNKPKGYDWSLNKKQRFDPFQKQQFTQKHKQQIVSKIKDNKKKVRSKSQSAVFASKSIKSHFQAEIYQTNNPFKAQLRKMINYKDERPGPGAYKCQNSFLNKVCKISKHQFFGSTVQRFNELNNSTERLGPGCYTPKVDLQKKSFAKRKQTIDTQEACIQRTSYIPKNSDIPGPGSYSVDNKRRHKSSCKWVFGSQKNRFQEPKFEQSNEQQITAYELEKKKIRQKQFEYRKQYLNQRKSSIFASTSKRFEQNKKGAQNIQIGQYNVTQRDIAAKIKKQIQKQKQIGRYQLTQSYPFMSSVERFKTQGNVNQQTHHDCWCLVKSVVKQVFHHQSAAFASKQKRTVVFQNKNAKNTPAVGSYSKNSTFLKNSFNSKFLAANQAKTKKIKIWNAQKSKTQMNESLKNQEKPLNLQIRAN